MCLGVFGGFESFLEVFVVAHVIAHVIANVIAHVIAHVIAQVFGVFTKDTAIQPSSSLMLTSYHCLQEIRVCRNFLFTGNSCLQSLFTEFCLQELLDYRNFLFTEFVLDVFRRVRGFCFFWRFCKCLEVFVVAHVIAHVIAHIIAQVLEVFRGFGGVWGFW